VNRLALGFEGPFAIVVGKGSHLERPLRSSLNILVATSGTEASRRAAEVAIALARASRAPITALYVASGKPGKSKTRALRDLARTRQREEAILKDVAEMADRYDVSLRTAMRVDDSPEAAILREARLRRHNLIVIGVSRRPGDTLFFGNLAEALLEQSDHSLLFVSSGGVSTAAQGKGQQKVQDDKAKEDDESEAA
jgi:nucleotide-binding universal stress UspA family protein